MTVASSTLALRGAVHARLAGDAALGLLLGGPRVFDDPPRAAVPPYVILSDVRTADASGDAVPAHEHGVTLEVWSREGGLAEALTIADRLSRLLDGAALALDGHRLASLDWVSTEAARHADGGVRRAAVAFRAVTEPDA
jgi:hypothetical protein